MENDQHKVVHEVLLQSARTDADIECISTLVGQLDSFGWKVLREQILRHRVFQLVYHNLELAGCENEVPEDVSLPISRAIERSKVEFADSLIELNRVFESFRSDGLQPVLFKGLSLGAYYGNPRLRHIGDFDLLFKESELTSMVESVKQLGYDFGTWSEGGEPQFYSQSTIEAKMDPRADLKHIPSMINPDFRSTPFEPTIELHPNVVPPSMADEFDVAGALNRSREIETSGARIRVLEDADSLWSCALNLQRDAEYIVFILLDTDLWLYRYCDVRELVSRSSAAVDALLERVTTSEARFACTHALRVTESLFPGTVPTEVISQLVLECPNAGNRIFHRSRPEGINLGETRIGTWSSDVPDRIFHNDRAREVLHYWWGLGDEALCHPATKVVTDRLGISPPK